VSVCSLHRFGPRLAREHFSVEWEVDSTCLTPRPKGRIEAHEALLVLLMPPNGVRVRVRVRVRVGKGA